MLIFVFREEIHPSAKTAHSKTRFYKTNARGQFNGDKEQEEKHPALEETDGEEEEEERLTYTIEEEEKELSKVRCV